MLRATLQLTVEAAVAALVREGRLPAAVADVAVEISDTKSPDHGDYACNFALVASKKAGMNPRALGETLREALLGSGTEDTIQNIEVAGPGFLNLRLKPEAVAAYVPKILAIDSFGHLENSNPQRINVEFVSVNPNGPITIGSGRGAAFGSALCNVLAAAGNVVHREYYINDGVNSEQMRLFAESVKAHVRKEALPEKGYKGEYVQDVAEQIASPINKGTIESGFAYNARHIKASELAQWKQESESGGRLAEILAPEIAKEEKRLTRWIHQATLFSKMLEEWIIGAAVGRELLDLYGAEILDMETDWYQHMSQALMIERQRGDLDAFGVEFDTWFSEQSLHDKGIVANRIEGLKQTGVADEQPYRTKLKLAKGGAIEETIIEDQPNEDEDEEDVSTANSQPQTANTLWLRSTKFGDDMDRVLRRRDGRLTYIASDVAYHENKLTRPENATRMITILGPDHHGYIGRLTAVVAALLRGPEDTPEANAKALAEAKEKLEVVIYQLVRFLKDGKPAPMRKRDGNIYELRDLMDELGKNLAPDGTKEEQQTKGRDVARFFYLMRSHDTTMDFDIDLATQQSDENPVFYAQYAHARICSVIAKAKDVVGGESWVVGGPDAIPVSLLVHPREGALIKKILDLPWEVERVAKDYCVHRLTTYAVELARTYHYFYDACRVIQPEQPELSQARLALCEATKRALKSTFGLLGVSAPERLERREAV